MTFAIACNLKTRLRLCARDLAMRATIAGLILSRLRLTERAPSFRDCGVELNHAGFVFGNRLRNARNVLIQR